MAQARSAVAAMPDVETDKILDWCEASLEKTSIPTMKATGERVKQVDALVLALAAVR